MATVLSPPSWWATLGETRAVAEWGMGLLLPEAEAPAGDGHPVLVLPGFLTPDAVTALLRRRLTAWGYDARPWGLGINWGPRPGVLRDVVRRIRAIHRETGRPVSLIGWSLGGAMAYGAAARLESEVRGLITLGSPFRADSRVSRASGVFAAASGIDPEDASVRRWLKKAPAQPFTAVVSRYDGVVSPEAGKAPKGPKSETVWVPSTHMGMIAHPCVMQVIADRLAQRPDRWRAFSAARTPWPWRALWGAA